MSAAGFPVSCCGMYRFRESLRQVFVRPILLFFFKKRQRKPGTRVSSLELSANFGRRFGKFRAAQAQCATKVLRVSVLIRRPVFNFFPSPFERGIAGKSLIFGSQDVFPVRPVIVFSRKVFRVFTKRKGIYKKQEIPSTRK